MNTRFTLVLLAILIVLVLGTVVSQRAGLGAVTPTPTPDLAVFTFTSSQVKQLSIETGGKKVMVAQASPGTWKLVTPPAPYANSTHIATVVATLANLQKLRNVPVGSNSLSVFGIGKPYLIATATLDNGKTESLVVGNQNPEKNGYYAQVKGQGGLFLASVVDIQALAQLAIQPPIATPTPVRTPLATPASIPTATPIATAAP
ncbi:MAG: DUF4340 domain-containing protein [Chloroflexi bacterium]|nr:DUF4340 domain-containing protein [Chloroflexota bacterium]